MISALIDGLLFGWAYAAPIGAQNIFVIHSALSQGLPRSYNTALFVSLMDISLGTLCFFGVGQILVLFPKSSLVILFVGMLYLLKVAYDVYRIKPKTVDNDATAESYRLSKIIYSSFALTFFNPQAIIDGSLLLGGFHAKLAATEHKWFLIGLCLASTSWFFTITSLVGYNKTKISHRVLSIINKACAMLLIFIASKFFVLFVQKLDEIF
jgi:L-lysine exporter family protein LysE/ArgO